MNMALNQCSSASLASIEFPCKAVLLEDHERVFDRAGDDIEPDEDA